MGVKESEGIGSIGIRSLCMYLAFCVVEWKVKRSLGSNQGASEWGVDQEKIRSPQSDSVTDSLRPLYLREQGQSELFCGFPP